MPNSARGMLLVYTTLGPSVTSAEYERWHDTTHVWPLLHLPGPVFLSATRYKAADGQTPEHLALYELASAEAVRDAGYVALTGRDGDGDESGDGGYESDDGCASEVRRMMGVGRETRGSGMEERVSRIERRVYEPLAERRRGAEEEGKYVSVVEVEMEASAEAEFARWFDEEHMPLLARVPGWVRSRRYGLKEVLGREGGRRAGQWLAVHEWTSVDVFGTREFKQATTTPWRAQVLNDDRVSRYHIRVFRVVGTWARWAV